MSECRICFNSTKETLVTPCKCNGSIKFIHQSCLIKWLKEKYPKELRFLLQSQNLRKTGIKCELCKYEFKLNQKYLKPSQILKKLRNSGQTYSVLVNLPVIFFLLYKCSNLFQHLLLFVYSLTLRGNKHQDLVGKLGHVFSIYLGFVSRLLPITVLFSILPLFLQSTRKQLVQLLLECKDIQIENLL